MVAKTREKNLRKYRNSNLKHAGGAAAAGLRGGAEHQEQQGGDGSRSRGSGSHFCQKPIIILIYIDYDYNCENMISY